MLNRFVPGLAAAAVLLAIAPALHAEALSTVIRGSAELGGEKLATVVYEDGYEDTTRAGDGFQFAIGVGIEHGLSWYSQATIGYKIGGSTGDNGDLDLTSVPLEVMTFHQTPRWRLGAGVTYMANPKMNGSGVLEGLDVAFEDAMGFIVEYDWRFANDPRFFLGVRGTAIDFETENVGTQVDGNSIGLTFGMNL